MLTSTFVHCRGVGSQTEQSLWRQGATHWDTYLDDVDRWQVHPSRRASLELGLDKSQRALDAGEFQYFGLTLPPSERWRSYPEFRDGIGYLDIETDGGVEAESITMVGLYFEHKFQVFIKGENLGSFPDAVERCSVLVTYFGTGFDIPMLKKAFPQLPFDQIHIDLCPTLRRLGLRGGLKSVEEQLGISRASETQGLSGWDAVHLWRQYLRGNDGALDTLIAYNREDCVNLEFLMAHAYDRLSAGCRSMMGAYLSAVGAVE